VADDKGHKQGGVCRGEAGELPPSLELTFPSTGLSENVGEWKRGEEGKGKGKGRETTYLTSPTGFCLKYTTLAINNCVTYH